MQTAIYGKLCNLILEGGVIPGKPVTVATLSEALNVSPMPVREAITCHVHVGALTRVSGRSLGVPELTAEKFEELKRVRQEIECVALAWATQRSDRDSLKLLEQLLADLRVAEQNHDDAAFISLNYQFHFTIYQHSDSPILVDIIRNLWLRITPYFHLLDTKGHMRISSRLHAELIEAIKASDTAQAQPVLKDDIERAYKQLLSFMK